MEHYTKGENVEVGVEVSGCLPEGCVVVEGAETITVLPSTRLRDVITTALDALKVVDQVIWVGNGAALVKAVSGAEVTKRRHHGLHQITTITCNRVEEYWEPKLEGLDRLRVTREIPAVVILLSRLPLNPTLPGYQAPGALGEDFCKADGRPRKAHKERRKREDAIEITDENAVENHRNKMRSNGRKQIGENYTGEEEEGGKRGWKRGEGERGRGGRRLSNKNYRGRGRGGEREGYGGNRGDENGYERNGYGANGNWEELVAEGNENGEGNNWDNGEHGRNGRITSRGGERRRGRGSWDNRYRTQRNSEDCGMKVGERRESESWNEKRNGENFGKRVEESGENKSWNTSYHRNEQRMDDGGRGRRGGRERGGDRNGNWRDRERTSGDWQGSRGRVNRGTWNNQERRKANEVRGRGREIGSRRQEEWNNERISKEGEDCATGDERKEKIPAPENIDAEE